MNRNPNVVTMGVGERVVKPATENSLGRFFLMCSEQTMKGKHEFTEENLAGGKWSELDGVHVDDRSRRAGILDGGSGHACRTESSSSLDEGSRLHYVTVFLHRLSRRSRA